jgi:ABC-type phosphate transport system auxiliary subunit
MSTPDPESFGLLAKVIAAGTALLAPVGWIYTKLDKKADKHTVNNHVQELKLEQTHQRDIQAKLFDKLEEHAKADSENFQRMFTKMSDNHSELLRELNRKQDR